jgi:hypothetical protein
MTILDGRRFSMKTINDIAINQVIRTKVVKRNKKTFAISLSIFSEELKDGWKLESAKISGNSLMIVIVKKVK